MSLHLAKRHLAYLEGIPFYLVDPYALLLSHSGLYLVGYSHRAWAERTFAVERIVKVAVTGDLVRDSLFGRGPGSFRSPLADATASQG